MIEVSAGIIRRDDGRILICQRGEGRHNAHLWEFPGGKREAGEDAAQCLVREVREELLMDLREAHEVCVREAEGIRFTFLAAQTNDEPVLTEHEAAAFVQPRELLNYRFCPADTHVAWSLALGAPPVTHYLWDFDGTLADTYPGLTAMLVKACGEVGITVMPKRALTLMKNSLGHAITVLAEENGLPRETLRAAVERQQEDALVASYPPVEGVPELLRMLHARGGKHYLVTHRGRAALDWLAVNELSDLFAGTVTKEDGFPRKPDPACIRHLMKQYHFTGDTAVMIGDRPLDTAAGRNAGALSCLLDLEDRFPDDPCDLRANSAAALAEILCPAW